MTVATAASYAEQWVARVRDDPRARLALLSRLYTVPPAVDRGYLPFRRAAAAFMGWQLRRGLLNPVAHPRPGSPWWRALNEALLRDTCEASAIAFGLAGTPSRPGVRATLDFIEAPTARTWYYAHNVTIASAYVAHAELARREDRVERFFLNLVLLRVLFAHALVSQPQLALGWLRPAGRVLGDPRLGMTSIFLSLGRVLPDSYPLGEDVESYVDAENSLGHLLDVGVIVPRTGRLYDWSAVELGLPELRGLVADGSVPSYAWDPRDAAVWRPRPSLLARAARWAVPA